MANEKEKVELDFENLLTKPFGEASKDIDKAIAEAYGDGEDSIAFAKAYRAKLNELASLRRDGTVALGLAQRELVNLDEDKRLEFHSASVLHRNAQKTIRREKKRKRYAIKLQLSELKNSYKHKILKEIRRDTNTAESLVGKSMFIDGDFNPSGEMAPLFARLNQGLSFLRSLNGEVLSSYEVGITSTKKELEKESAKGEPGDSIGKAKYQLEIESLKTKISVLEYKYSKSQTFAKAKDEIKKAGGDGFQLAAVDLAYECASYLAKLPYETSRFGRRRAKAKARYEYLIDSAKEKANIQAKRKAIEESIQTKERRDDILERIADAKAVSEKNDAKVKALAKELARDIKAHFDIVIGEADKRLRQTHESSYQRLKSGVIKADSLPLEKRQKAKDEVYVKEEKRIALASYISKAFRKEESRLLDDVKLANKTRTAYPLGIKKGLAEYYKPEEVVNDPKLVDTASMRLVIVGSKSTETLGMVEKREKAIQLINLGLVYLFLIVMAVVIIFPFYWMLITSLKSQDEIRSVTTPTFWPGTDTIIYNTDGTIKNIVVHSVAWSNYVEAFTTTNLLVYMRNTIVVGVFSTLGVLITCILSAFAFARLKFKGRDTLFNVFLATMMIPGEMMVITNYLTVSSFGWISTDSTLMDAYLAMILPFCVSVFYIYLLRQNFKQIPEELYLAAKVDGKSDWQFLWAVMVPLCAPTLITITILELMGSWNAYVWPNLVASKDAYKLISNGIRNSFIDSSGETMYGVQMAGSVAVTVPLLLLFIIFRKYIMRGMGRAGIKG